MKALALAIVLVVTAACSQPRSSSASKNASDPATSRASLETIRLTIEALRPLGVALPEPKPGDWRADFNEPPQNFDEYLASSPTLARGDRRTIYVQPLGAFSPDEQKIVDLTAEFLGVFFGLPVVTLSTRSLDSVPKEAQRDGLTGRQILAGHIVNTMLAPVVPEDGAVLVGLTNVDLYPEPSWNYVFGLANLQARAGVWSMARLGFPGDGPAAFRECLLRTLKIASHETGHAFSLPHCVLFQCTMNGSNSLEETDEGPLELCPVCTGKLAWATGADVQSRLERIEAFCRRNGLKEEEVLARRSIEALMAPAAAAVAVGASVVVPLLPVRERTCR